MKGLPESNVQFGGFLAGLMSIGVVDSKTLEVLHAQEPLNKGFNSQLQRANKAIKKKKEEQEAEKKEKEDTEQESAKEDEEVEEAVTKKKKNVRKGKKKPGPKPGKGGQKGQEAKESKEKGQAKLKKLKCKSKKRETNTETPEADEGDTGEHYPDTPEGFDPTIDRAKNRKRWTSRYYHYAYDEAWRQWKSHQECLAAAREGSKAASEEFERLWPTAATKSVKQTSGKKEAPKAKKVKKSEENITPPKEGASRAIDVD